MDCSAVPNNDQVGHQFTPGALCLILMYLVSSGVIFKLTSVILLLN